MKIFDAYEPFPSTNGPEVLVRENVLERCGIPEINHDNLEQLFTDELKLPAKDFTVKFHGGNAIGNADAPLDVWRNGFRTPFSNTLHVPVYHNGWDRTPMHRLINIGLLTAEKRHRNLPLRLLPTEWTLGSGGLLTIGIETNSLVPVWAGMIGLGMVGIAKASYSNPSRFVDGTKATELRKKHDSDVYFPKLGIDADAYLDRKKSA